MKELDILQDAHIKVTPQRIAILRLLKENSGHLGVKPLYNLVSQQYPNISLATIYKTLELFRSKGVLRAVAVASGEANCCSSPDFNSRLVCSTCKSTFDIPVPEIDLKEYLEDVSSRSGYRLTSQQLVLYGLCPKCSRQEA